MLAEKLERTRDREDQHLSDKVLVMQPILRLLQLLCENHNRHLQVSVNYYIFKYKYFLHPDETTGR